MPRALSVGIVLYHGREFLLLQYAAGHWGFAKGEPGAGEEFLDAARREVKEETGLEGVYVAKDFMVREQYFFKREGKTVFKEVVYFLGEAPKKDVVLSKEHKGFVWLQFEEAMTRINYPETRNVLKEARDYLQQHGIL